MSKKTLIRMIAEVKNQAKTARYAVIAGKLTVAEMCSLAWKEDIDASDIKAILKGNKALDGVSAVYAASAIAEALGTDWRCSLDANICAACAAAYAAYMNAKAEKATATRALDTAIEAATIAYKATHALPNDASLTNEEREAARREYWDGLDKATHTPDIDKLRKAATEADAKADAEKAEYNKACLEVDSGYRTALALRRAGVSSWRLADKPDASEK